MTTEIETKLIEEPEASLSSNTNSISTTVRRTIWSKIWSKLSNIVQIVLINPVKRIIRVIYAPFKWLGNHWLFAPWMQWTYHSAVSKFIEGGSKVVIFSLALIGLRLVLAGLVIPVYESLWTRYAYFKITPPVDHDLYLPQKIQTTIDDELQIFQRRLQQGRYPPQYSLFCHGAPGNGKSETMRYISRKLSSICKIYEFNPVPRSHFFLALGFHSQSQRLINLLNHINKNGGVLILDEFDTTVSTISGGSGMNILETFFKPTQSKFLTQLLVPLDASNSVKRYRLIISCSNNKDALNQRLTREGRLGDLDLPFEGLDTKNEAQINRLHQFLVNELANKEKAYSEFKSSSSWTKPVIDKPDYFVVPLETFKENIIAEMDKVKGQLTSKKNRELERIATVNSARLAVMDPGQGETNHFPNIGSEILGSYTAMQKVMAMEKERFEGVVNSQNMMAISKALRLAKKPLLN